MPSTPSESRTDRIGALKTLLSESDKGTVLAALGEQGYRFEEGFDQKDLSAIQDAVREAIAQMEEMNGEVAGNTAPERVDIYETQLEGPQVEWVRSGIEARYDRTRLVNAPLLKVDGVPAFPDKEAALKSALKQLTREQVAYMMEEGRSPFMFQMKLVGPSKKGIDLQRTLINEQPKRMGVPKQEQQEVYVPEGVERHLEGRSSAEKTEWKWEFVQGEQIIEPQKEDDVSLLVGDRVEKVRRARPTGMRGTDRYTLATLMADGLEQGKPLGCRFKDDATNTEEYEVLNATLMDEEGEFTEHQYRYLVRGGFDPILREACVHGCHVDFQADRAGFRASVDGSIEA